MKTINSVLKRNLIHIPRGPYRLTYAVTKLKKEKTLQFILKIEQAVRILHLSTAYILSYTIII